jgi:hypothetical protein
MLGADEGDVAEPGGKAVPGLPEASAEAASDSPGDTEEPPLVEDVEEPLVEDAEEPLVGDAGGLPGAAVGGLPVPAVGELPEGGAELPSVDAAGSDTLTSGVPGEDTTGSETLISGEDVPEDVPADVSGDDFPGSGTLTSGLPDEDAAGCETLTTGWCNREMPTSGTLARVHHRLVLWGVRLGTGLGETDRGAFGSGMELDLVREAGHQGESSAVLGPRIGGGCRTGKCPVVADNERQAVGVCDDAEANRSLLVRGTVLDRIGHGLVDGKDKLVTSIGVKAKRCRGLPDVLPRRGQSRA